MKRRGFTIVECLVVLAIIGILAALLIPAIMAVRNRSKVAAVDNKAESGVHRAHTKVATGSDGMTVEQRNVVERLKRDNDPGSIKHLYVISAYSGDVILYSTVKGKVTSSGKRLTPTSVAAGVNNYGDVGSQEAYGEPVTIGGRAHYTSEVLQDDGTYGSSVEYLYWFDVQDRYHQHYVAGGQIVHVSSEPLTVPKIILNLSDATKK